MTIFKGESIYSMLETFEELHTEDPHSLSALVYSLSCESAL